VRSKEGGHNLQAKEAEHAVEAIPSHIVLEGDDHMNALLVNVTDKDLITLNEIL
jgi:hypothetical protein